MHAISSYRGNRPPTNPQTNTQTGPITMHCVAKLSAQCNKQTHRQDRLQYTAPQLASAQCNKVNPMQIAIGQISI